MCMAKIHMHQGIFVGIQIKEQIEGKERHRERKKKQYQEMNDKLWNIRPQIVHRDTSM